MVLSYNDFMKNLFTFMLVLFSSLAHGLTCQKKETVDLSVPGGSLYPLRITNQNGLGICHIEQLNKMIKSKLPGHPDLSRVQLAIAEKQVRGQSDYNKKAIRYMTGSKVGGSYIDAGNSCEAFERIKGMSICPAAHDRIEQLTKMNPFDQEKIIGILSMYFDSKPKVYSSLFFDKTQPIVNHQHEATAAFLACPVPEALTGSLKLAYINHVKSLKKSLGTKYESSLNSANSLAWDKFAMNGESYVSGLNYKNHLEKTLPFFKESPESPTAKMLNSQIARYALAMENNEKCVSEKWENNLSVPFCSNNPNQISTKNLFSLVSLGVNLREIANLINGSSDRDEFFSKAFSCDSEKYSVSKSINCKTVDLYKMSSEANSVSAYQTKISQMIDAQVNKGTAVGISTCTRFFKNPNATTMKIGTDKFNCGDKTSPEYTNGEGSHAVTIIGIRCVNGAEEYLVQNSWGSGCYYSDKFECTHQGGFWASAASVINNIRNFNYLE